MVIIGDFDFVKRLYHDIFSGRGRTRTFEVVDHHSEFPKGTGTLRYPWLLISAVLSSNINYK